MSKVVVRGGEGCEGVMIVSEVVVRGGEGW